LDIGDYSLAYVYLSEPAIEIWKRSGGLLRRAEFQNLPEVQQNIESAESVRRENPGRGVNALFFRAACYVSELDLIFVVIGDSVIYAISPSTLGIQSKFEISLDETQHILKGLAVEPLAEGQVRFYFLDILQSEVVATNTFSLSGTP
jgi:hypothetical protein